MLADDLENLFSRVFKAKPYLHTDEITWLHGQTRYRLRYQLKHVRELGSFVHETYLDDTNTCSDRVLQLGRANWNPDHTVQQVAQWTAKLILTRDAC